MSDATASSVAPDPASTPQSSAALPNQPEATASASASSVPSDATPSSTSTALVHSPDVNSLPTRKGPKGSRHLQPKQATKPGRRSSWPPKKLAWLESHIPQFLACTTDAQASKFYDRMVYLWFNIFGWSLPVRQDPEGDIDEAAALEKPEEAVGQMTEEEANEKGRLVQSVRATISNWFRNERQKGKTGKNTGMTMEKFIKTVSGEQPALPRRLSLIQYYTSEYWDRGISILFKQIRDRNTANWKAMVAAGTTQGKKKPSHMAAMNEAVATKWAAVSEEFKEELDKERASKRKTAEDGLHSLMSPNDEERTPQEYQDAIDKAAELLHPVVSAIFEKMGLVSTVILAGPMPNEGGKIKVRALTFGRTADFEQQLFPDAMKDAYFKACSAMHDFAAKCFPQSVCDSRALKTNENNADTITTPSSTSNESPAAPTSDSSPERPQSITPAAATSASTSATALPTESVAPEPEIGRASSRPQTPAANARPQPAPVTHPHPLTPQPPPAVLQQKPPQAPPMPEVPPRPQSPGPTLRHGPPDGSWAPDTAPGETGPLPSAKPRPRPVRSSHARPIPFVEDAIPIDPALLEERPSQAGHTPSSVIPENGPQQPEHSEAARPVFGIGTLGDIARPSTPPPSNTPPDPIRSPLAQRQSQQYLPLSPPRPSIYSQPTIEPREHTQRQPSTEDLPVSINLNILPSKMAQYCRLFVEGKGAWGEDWVRCVEAFIRVEQIDGSPVEAGGPRFTAKARPTQVDRWFKYGRPVEDYSIPDLDVWSSSWWSWWAMLVPGRQAVHGDPPSSPVSEDFSWEVLDNTRSCGIVVLMVSLSWWGKRVMANGAGLDGVRQWRNAVQEVTFAFGEVEKLKKENGEKENEDGDGDEEGEGSEVEESAVTRGKKRKQPPENDKSSRGARRRQNKRLRA